MDHLAIHRQCHRLGGIDDSLDISLGNLTAFPRDCNHPAAVDPLDVAAGNPHEGRKDIHPSHQLGLFQGALDRVHGDINVYHDPFSETFGRTGPDADDVERPVLRQLSDDGTDLGGADI